MKKQIPIHLDGQYQYFEFINMIARDSFIFIGDQGEFHEAIEALFQLPDNSFIVCTIQPLELDTPGTRVGKHIRTKIYERVPNPALWLLTHGHERLAAYMFPKIKEAVERDCVFNDKDFRKYRGETFYGADETFGETFRGKPPL